ncbi:hypothetical protein F5887DRAFT_1081003 [Amanita rubescens]|nr:hypothetical protein F5887DRAFT_1081003 [Amanita rubescens]
MFSQAEEKSDGRTPSQGESSVHFDFQQSKIKSPLNAQTAAFFNERNGIDLLPDDVLRETFLSCDGERLKIRSLSESDPEKAPQNPPLPLVLSSICSSWRRVALSTPQLWSSIGIASFTEHSTLVAAEWLSRARGLPVSIYIKRICYDDEHVYAKLTIFLSAYHIRSLNVFITGPLLEHDRFMSELPVESVASLERLTLTASLVGSIPVRLNSARYPRLQYLSLLGHYDSDSAITLPWTSLRKLDLTRFSLQFTQCLYILRQCTSLHSASLFVVPAFFPTGHEQVYLPNLSCLSFRFTSPTVHMGTYFDVLAVPSLTYLAIDQPATKSYEDPPEIIWSSSSYARMIEGSHYPPIHQLIIPRTKDPVDLGDLLRHTPTLTRLTLLYGALDEDTSKQLAEGRLGPNLQHLDIEEIRGVTREQFLDIISMRVEDSKQIEEAPRGTITSIKFVCSNPRDLTLDEVS